MVGKQWKGVEKKNLIMVTPFPWIWTYETHGLNYQCNYQLTIGSFLLANAFITGIQKSQVRPDSSAAIISFAATLRHPKPVSIALFCLKPSLRLFVSFHFFAASCAWPVLKSPFLSPPWLVLIDQLLFWSIVLDFICAKPSMPTALDRSFSKKCICCHQNNILYALPGQFQWPNSLLKRLRVQIRRVNHSGSFVFEKGAFSSKRRLPDLPSDVLDDEDGAVLDLWLK